MILTVTLNAALDVTYQVAALRPHTSHRVTRVQARAGGKGVNVARVLHTLGVPVVVTGLAGGPTGQAIRAGLARAALPDEMIEIEGESRRTVTVVADGDATVFNEPGPVVSAREWAALRARFGALAARADAVVLAGSLPPGVPGDAYRQLIGASPALTVLDTSGLALTGTLSAGPGVVKPNAAELREATGCPGVRAGALALLAAGAKAVVASDGPGGLLAVTASGCWRARPPELAARNPTGAGDAAVAALTAALVAGRPWPDALAAAVAVSAAAVLTPAAGDVDRATCRRLRGAVTVEELDADPDR